MRLVSLLIWWANTRKAGAGLRCGRDDSAIIQALWGARADLAVADLFTHVKWCQGHQLHRETNVPLHSFKLVYYKPQDI